MAETIDYELTEAEAALLTAATKDAAAAAGALGGSLGGWIGGGPAGREGGRSGGASGGRFGARFTKAQTAATTVDVPGDPETVHERARATIGASGAVIDDPNAAGDGSVWGFVGSGAMNMAPALVRVEVEPAGTNGSRVHIRATGKEGLIRQKIGAKAADRIAEGVVAG